MYQPEDSPDFERRLSGDLDALDDFAQELAQLTNGRLSERPQQAAPGSTGSVTQLPERINADQDNVEQGLAKLVLTVVELVRQLMERQAIRRIEAGTVTDDEIERMGETFLRLEQKMVELKATFGLEDEDLNLNLGPLGNLLPD